MEPVARLPGMIPGARKEHSHYNQNYLNGDPRMPRTILTLTVFVFFLVSTASGQKLEPPKQESTELTAQQKQTVKKGVALHDKGDYDGAIDRYQEVLKENPSNNEVLYEMAYSYYAKKDYSKSLDLAYRAAQLKSDLLPAIYVLIGNIQDEQGDSKKAIETYKAGIKIQPSNPANGALYFNMAIAYGRAGQLDEARVAVKKSASMNPKHAGGQLLLSNIFFKGEYRIPALLAACRFLILEPDSKRSDTALQIVQRVMQAGVSQGKNSNEINIFVSTEPKKKDEGDFSSIEAIMGLVKAADYTEKNKGKSEAQLLVGNFESLLTFLGEAKSKDQSKFTWKYYVPYFLEMKKRGYIEPFVYYIHQRSDVPGVKEWLEKNGNKVLEFLNWSESYGWPRAD
jgi:tetratricopeptide (TPR) repeat protein